MKLDVFEMDTEELFDFVKSMGWKVSESDGTDGNDGICLTPPPKKIVLQNRDDFADALQCYFESTPEEEQGNESLEEYFRAYAEGAKKALSRVLSEKEALERIEEEEKSNKEEN